MPYKDPEKAKAHRAAYKAAHREEIRIKDAEYRIANSDKIREAKKSDALAHPGRIHAAQAMYRETHREQIRAIQKAYEARHPERIKEQARQRSARYRAAHPDKVRTYYTTHPEMRYAIEARRRAQKKQAPQNDFTAAQWKEMQAAYNHRCAYCGKRAKGHLTIDHITPLSKGGPHTASNIVPACRQCNSKKFTGAPLCPVQPLLLTVAPPHKKNGKQ